MFDWELARWACRAEGGWNWACLNYSDHFPLEAAVYSGYHSQLWLMKTG
jgi:hypothetical protein